MVIKDLSGNQKMHFGNLELEDVFKWDNRLFMKVANADVYPNAYDFTKSRLTDLTAETEVAYVPSELILHERGWELDN
ncbi:MAG: hypothetical protein U0L05_01305 [Schaedlerella sp.]|nr:hypothetical protein [Schaedlerella sp.]